MRPQDQAVFAAAAKEFQVWILVRRTNRASLKYIGRPGYVPKPIDCKPKTADRDAPGKGYEWAGLVVDPTRCPEAFTAGRLSKAKDVWEKFAREQNLAKAGPNSRYRVQDDAKSKHYGCLLLQGSCLHGDYDLYDIIPVANPRGNLAAVETLLGQPHMRGPLFYKVQKFVNSRIGVDMVQHGGEAQYADHSEQSLDAFGPNGEQCTILNEFSVRAWYATTFQGRQTLGKT